MNSLIPKPILALLIILCNLIPVYAVVVLDWKSFDLIFLYWLENLIIGLFMVLRMLIRRYSGILEVIVSLYAIPFTAFHYTLFCIFHGIFIMVIFDQMKFGDNAPLDLFYVSVSMIKSGAMEMAVLGLVLVHLVDWIRDWFKSAQDVGDIVWSGYKRIMLTHFTIIACGYALLIMENPDIGLLFLIAIKTIMDFHFYFRTGKSSS
ncbi:MAG: hypothetical protein IPK77_13760 [Cellvibrio sp.]|nr:hypothetical protein [Cellvibrio sp.]